MLRFFAFLFGRHYEPCHACEVLQRQLEFERSEKRLLIDTLVSIVKPKEVEAAAPIEINQIQQSSALFSRRRAALEERDRQEAKILAEKKYLGVPDKLRGIPVEINPDGKYGKPNNEVEQLEKELGVEEA